MLSYHAALRSVNAHQPENTEVLVDLCMARGTKTCLLMTDATATDAIQESIAPSSRSQRVP